MPAGSTYTPIATTTLGSAQASVTFNSFSGYTDLILIINAGTANTGQSIYLQYNSNTANNYSSTDMWGNGSTASSGRSTSIGFIRVLGRGIGTDNTVIGNSITQIMNYSNTTTFKTLVNRSNVGGGTTATVGLWRSTSAITSLTLTGDGPSNILAGSTFTLYGIASA
jgi:hypothetical protein